MSMQAAYPLLKASGAGRMIMISSVAGGPTALRSGTIYAMTKGTFSVKDCVSGLNLWQIGKAMGHRHCVVRHTSISHSLQDLLSF